MNTKTQAKQEQAHQRPLDQQKQRSKEPGENPNKLHDDRKPHEHERPETRLTR
jgi:hypothetical protein